MIAIPAVDLRDGACVQLVGGSFQQVRVRLDDPIEVAASWARVGFSWLHVVDLDAATGRGSNLPLVRELLDDTTVPVQVGGGVRSIEQADELLDAGASRIIVGTRALEEEEWIAELAARHPGEIVVACDVRERRVTTRGWSHTLPLDILDVVEELASLHRTDARNREQRGGHGAHRAALALERHGEAVCLVARLLQEPQSGRATRDAQRLAASDDEHLFLALGQRDERLIAHA